MGVGGGLFRIDVCVGGEVESQEDVEVESEPTAVTATSRTRSLSPLRPS